MLLCYLFTSLEIETLPFAFKHAWIYLILISVTRLGDFVLGNKLSLLAVIVAQLVEWSLPNPRGPWFESSLR